MSTLTVSCVLICHTSHLQHRHDCSARPCPQCTVRACRRAGGRGQRTQAKDFRQPRENVWSQTIQTKKQQQGSFDPAELGNEGAACRARLGAGAALVHGAWVG